MGHTVVVGRKTYESFGRALEGRTVIVVSSKADTNPDVIERAVPGIYDDMIYYAPSLTEAIGCARRLNTYRDDPEELVSIYVAGGASLYKEAWDIADYLDFTLVLNRRNTVYDTCIPGFNVNNWILSHTPIKVEAMIEGHATKTVSHIHYQAAAVKPGTKKAPTSPRDMMWIFDHGLGHREMFNETIRPGSVVEDDVVEEIATTFTRRFGPAPSAKELAAMLEATAGKTPEGERDYFNVWTNAPDIDKEFRVLSILNKASETVRAADKSFDLRKFIGEVVAELEVATGIKRSLPDSVTWVGDDGVINTLSAPGIAAAQQSDASEGPIATMCTRMTDEAVTNLLDKFKSEQ